jgi:hypothetical protein
LRSPAAAPAAKIAAFAPPEAPEKVSPAPGRDVERRRERHVLPGEVRMLPSNAFVSACICCTVINCTAACLLFGSVLGDHPCEQTARVRSELAEEPKSKTAMAEEAHTLAL